MFVAFGIYSDVYKYDAILQDLELEDHVAQNERSRGSGRRSLGEVAQKNVKSESLVEAYTASGKKYRNYITGVNIILIHL